MTDPSPFVLSPVAPAPSDPRLLTLHLDICRMKAELELLETRIGRIRASEAEAAADTRPFVDRAHDLLERTVESLYESGRAEIEAIDRQSRLDSEARLSEASRHAQMLLAAARDDLADALTERAEALEPAPAPPADVVILPDEGLLVLPGDDLIVLPDPGLVVLPGDDAVVPSDDGLTVVAGDELLLVLPDDDLAPQPARPLDDGVRIDDDPGGPSEPTSAPVDAALVLSPADEPAAPSEAIDEAPGAAPSVPATSKLPGLSGSWAPSDLSHTPPAEGATEVIRADAAFDVWLAMASPAAPSDEAGSAAPTGSQADRADTGRPGWLRPLEAVAALLLVAILVVIGLALVG